ncbi:putative sugar nucleotidyl transferase [Niabella aquatica]
MQIIFSDKYINTAQLYPFVLTRKIEDIRVGIFTIREKWERLLGAQTRQGSATTAKGLVISSNVLPGKELLVQAKKLKAGQAICDEEGNVLVHHTLHASDKFTDIITVEDCMRIVFPWHIFQLNARAIELDFELVRKGRKKILGDGSVHISNKKNVLIEEGAEVKHTIINADEGPVFIEKGALVMEGCLLRGPVYIGAGAVVKMGTRIYGATTIGPGCTVGGEIKNSVLFAFSNKAHDGYLGDAVIGEWCNIGGGTSNSNLKNTAGDITVHLQGKKFTAGKKCGVLMGDFSRTAINTSFNSGTVVGVSANVFGCGLTPKYIPSFSWGFDSTVKYELHKALKDAGEWKKFKKSVLTESEIKTLTNIYNSKTKIK